MPSIDTNSIRRRWSSRGRVKRKEIKRRARAAIKRRDSDANQEAVRFGREEPTFRHRTVLESRGFFRVLFSYLEKHPPSLPFLPLIFFLAQTEPFCLSLSLPSSLSRFVLVQINSSTPQRWFMFSRTPSPAPSLSRGIASLVTQGNTMLTDYPPRRKEKSGEERVLYIFVICHGAWRDVYELRVRVRERGILFF